MPEDLLGIGSAWHAAERISRQIRQRVPYRPLAGGRRPRVPSRLGGLVRAEKRISSRAVARAMGQTAGRVLVPLQMGLIAFERGKALQDQMRRRTRKRREEMGITPPTTDI